MGINTTTTGINTTTSIKKASNVLGDKCDATIKEMPALLKKAGVADGYKTTKVLIPRATNSGDDVLFVGLNGVRFYFRKGTSVQMPEPLLEILQNSGEL